MKKWAHYFNDLFKKYDILVILLAIGSISLAFYKQNLSTIPLTIKYLMVAFPSLIALANIGNFKKQANLLDVGSIIFLFVYLYFSIASPEIFSIMMTVVLLIEVIAKAIVYQNEEEIQISPSKVFFSRFNYRFPAVALILLGFGSSFCTKYILDAAPNAYESFNITIGVCSTLVPLVYLIIVSFTASKKLSFLDYMYVLLCCFILGLILIYYPKTLEVYRLYTFILPGLCLCLRAHNFDGEIITKKKKYVSALCAKFHIILPIACGFAVAYVLSHATLYKLFELDQNIYVLIVGVVCVILTIAVFCMKNLKATSIKAIDYVLLLAVSILFFSFLYVLCVVLGFYGDSVKKDVFSNMFSLIGLFMLAVCLIVVVILYFIRHKHFMLNTDSPVELIEKFDEPQEKQEEANEESEEVVEPEEIVEEPKEEETPVAEETPVEPEPIEEPKQEEVIEPVAEALVEETPAEEVADEEEEEESEAQEEEETPSEEETTEVDPDAWKHPTIVVPEDESQNHMTKVKYLGRLMFSDKRVKYLYSEVKNYFASYGVTSRISNNKETFKKKGVVGIVRLAGKSLNVYLAILPEPFMEEGLNVKNVSDMKQYAETPTLIKIKTNKSIKEFKEIVNVMMIHRDIKKKSRFEPVDYEQELIPNGEAILNGLGYSSEPIVPTMNAKIIPNDMPQQLINYVPYIEGESIPEDVVPTPVYLDTICNYFDDGAIIRKEDLIEKKLLKENQIVLIKARGTLDKCLTIYADDFESDALKMIYITNGKAVLIKH